MENQSKHYDDEIDLFELFQNIWNEKILVALALVITTALAVAFALFTTPTYKVSALLKEPSSKDLEGLNSLDIIQLDTSAALNRVFRELNSFSARKDFYEANVDLFNPKQLENFRFDKFNEKAFSLSQKDFKKEAGVENYLRLSLDYNKPLQGVELLNGMVGFLIQQSMENLLEDLKVSIEQNILKTEAEIQSSLEAYNKQIKAEVTKLQEQDKLKELQLHDELQALRKSLKEQRENRIKVLDEAIAIADKLGIKKPTNLEKPASSSNKSSNDITINNQNLPLYFMGTDALNAEKQNLLNRTNDDFTSLRVTEINKELELLKNNRKIETLLSREDNELFLKDISDKTYYLAKLNNINLEEVIFKLAVIDQQAQEPTSPIKPKRSLIVAVGAVLGLMLGIFLALIVSAVKARKQFVA